MCVCVRVCVCVCVCVRVRDRERETEIYETEKEMGMVNRRQNMFLTHIATHQDEQGGLYLPSGMCQLRAMYKYKSSILMLLLNLTLIIDCQKE